MEAEKIGKIEKTEVAISDFVGKSIFIRLNKFFNNYINFSRFMFSFDVIIY